MSEKISLTHLILEKFQGAGELALEAIFPKNRVESKAWRQVLGLPTGYEFSSRTFSVILSRLKKQGLVSRAGSRKKSLWSITQKGNDSFGVVDLGLPKEDGMPRLVMFDIPESERKKRDLIRSELIACGYRQLQKSVWMGHRPLSEDFIMLLDNLKLKNKVQIVSINKLGSLETI